MIVMKFGGTVLHHESGFLSMVEIIKQKKDSCIIVISAFSDITRRLDKALTLALQQDLQSSLSMIDEILSYHIELSNALHKDSVIYHQELENSKSLLTRLVKGVSLTKEISPKTRDLFLSQGEIMAIQFVNHLLVSNDIQVHMFDARSIIITNNEYGNAKPLEYQIQYKVHEILPVVKDHDVMIIAGFIGSTESGEVTTMGYESSNLTATIIGSMFKAQEIQIWTDVSGIRSADPKLCSESKSIQHVNYAIATLLAHHGLKLLHHWMIDLPMKNNIPVSIRNAFDSNGECTIIDAKPLNAIPTIFMLSENTTHNDVCTVTFITDNPNVLKNLYEYCVDHLFTDQMSISTFVTPVLHKAVVPCKNAPLLIQHLHSIIEDNHEISS